MIIRKAKKADIASINKLDKESTRYHEKFDKEFFTISEHFWKMKVDSKITAMNDSTNLILVAKASGKVV